MGFHDTDILESLGHDCVCLRNTLYVFALFGIIHVLRFVLEGIKGVYVHCLRGGKNLKKYGDWAIVTGATSGIGEATAFELARKGLNVLIISRTQSKLDKVKEEIEAKYQKSEVRTLAIDYSNFDAADQEAVASAISGIEVGVLVNNVGVNADSAIKFDDISADRVSAMANVNCRATALMTHIVLPQMKKRGRGAIVNVSTGFAQFPNPFYAMYSGTKSFVNAFSRSLRAENPKLDIQIHSPNFVASKMSKVRAGGWNASAKGYARAAVKQIGYGAEIAPFPIHAVMNAVLRWLIPDFVRDFALLRMHTDINRRYKKKLARKAKEAKKSH